MNDARVSRMDRRIRLSGSLVMLGLLVEAVTLIWADPLSFLAFAFVGGALVAAGVLIYLISLISVGERSSRD